MYKTQAIGQCFGQIENKIFTTFTTHNIMGGESWKLGAYKKFNET